MAAGGRHSLFHLITQTVPPLAKLNTGVLSNSHFTKVNGESIMGTVGANARKETSNQQKDGTNKITRSFRLLGILTAILTITFLTGCSTQCEQDYPPPSEISTYQNPYRIDYSSSDEVIQYTYWENITIGVSGNGVVTHGYGCFWFVGCGESSFVSNDIQLTQGLNTVYTYEGNDGCEWRDDYLITLN